MSEQLDRREKITEILEIFGTKMKEICDEQPYLMMLVAKSCKARAEALDQIIALFPDELQFNPDYLDFQKGVEATRAIWKVKVEELKREWNTIYRDAKIFAVEEVKRETEERIFKWGEEQCQRHHTSGIWFKRRECTKCWQALKGE